ncbi:MAG TPA: PHP domain-containing protein, partial [Gemmatimonadales bacterium]|nr:PHP domain-containing protein [Gemmatimonadales bacterium]
MFTHLHVHTWFSMGQGASSPEALMAAAAARGFTALACTDTNGVYGAVEFQRTAEEAGIHPILGVQLVSGGEECVALAMDERGWGAICRAVTVVHWGTAGRQVGRSAGNAAPTSHPADLPSCRLADLLAHDRAGALILSASVPFLERIVALSGPDDVYAELRPGKARHAVLAAARRLGLPPVVTNAVMFAHAEDWARHRMLVAIGGNTTISTVEERVRRYDGTTVDDSVPSYRPTVLPSSPDAWLKPAAELARHFPDVPDAIDRAGELAERCRYRIPFGRIIPPRYAEA